MSKGELARRAGLTHPALSRLLSGTNGARLETVERLASAVGMRLALVPDDDFAADLLSGRILDFPSDDRSRA
ncbi:helix-turn-helix domain-containing protein [Antarcticirhabdus aurantiaca]|uniref:Helix-turn-helix transcriptional regulator n=1 Tax=Antarcticirhabdus aurantiaca TaxID=2606717 RepID=A0ACD4NW22_9HYPH|nr:helix-turn-helix transcriptional regulator [Antarcticirhabdus aurantiaca]WAJ31240.1 helix-turn-helix transcriptional regulator [Jeongeuplla avenae]